MSFFAIHNDRGKGEFNLRKGFLPQLWFWSGFALSLYVLLLISSIPVLGLVQWPGVHGMINNAGIRILVTLVLMVISALAIWWFYRYHTRLWLRQVITPRHVWWTVAASGVGGIALAIIAFTLAPSTLTVPLIPGLTVELLLSGFAVFVSSLLFVWVLQGILQERLNRLPDFPKWAAVLLPIICYVLVSWGSLSDNLSALVVSGVVAGIYQATRDWQCSWLAMALLTMVSLGLPPIGIG